MKINKLQFQGGAAFAALSSGGVITIIGIVFIFLNALYSAAGFVELTGGIIPAGDHIWFPMLKFFEIKQAGEFGILPGILASIFVSIIQFFFWIVNRDTVIGRDRWFRLFCYLLIAYDFISTEYYLLFGALANVHEANVWILMTRVVLILAGSLLITFIFLSVGAERWTAFGVELVRYNWEEGILFLQSAFNGGIDKLDSLAGGESNSDDQRRSRRRRHSPRGRRLSRFSQRRAAI